MPVAALEAIGRPLEALARGGGVARAVGSGDDAGAAEAGPAHGVQIGLRRLFVDHGDAAGVGAARLHAVERGGVCPSRTRSASRSRRAPRGAPDGGVKMCTVGTQYGNG